MYDISLYGHLTLDTIVDGENVYKKLGAMANMWRTFARFGQDIKLGVYPTSFAEAMIYIDRNTCKRYSTGMIIQKNREAKILESNISHVLYLNELPGAEYISQFTGTVSADLCTGKKINDKLLKYVDYLFVSKEDLKNPKTISKKLRGYMIAHDPYGSDIYFDDILLSSYKMPENEFVESANVLGAGDIFASCFLYGMHHNMSSTIEWAHKTTSNIIREQNEEV